MFKEEEPLVSIIVITYNSSKYVIETLESAKAQTYQNIELIVSDDCSTDDTVEICEKWVQKNKDRFVRTEILTVKENTGIPSNCNRGAKKAKGIWIKFIAGDDILVSIGIEECIKFTKSFLNANIVFSKQHSFTEENRKKTFSVINPQMHIYNEEFYSNNSSVKTQFNYLLKRMASVSGPSYIIKKDLLRSINYFDEKYRLLEDYPMFMKALELGNYFYFLDKITVHYRVHQKSISFHGTAEKICPNFYHDWYHFLMHYNFKCLNPVYMVDLLIEVLIYKIILLMGNRGKIAKIIWMNRGWLSPVKYLHRLRMLK